MNSLFLYSLAIVVGFVFLVWSADRFIHGSSAIARNLGVSPLIIGLTIVGFGTSSPELLISGMAAWSGSTGIAIGNAIGSNITNIALVIGMTALIRPLDVHSDTLKREFPVLVTVTLLAMALMIDGDLVRLDGIILLSCLGILIYWIVRIGLQTKRTDPMKMEYDKEIPKKGPMKNAVLWFGVGLVVLLISSKTIVWGAIGIATSYGISDLVIGLTIIALGTSLPELAASIASALKNEHDIAIGNIIGSNMFNLLGVLGLPGIIYPSVIDDAVLARDFPVMVVLTIALGAMAYGFRDEGRIDRVEGGVLLAAFFAYLSVIYVTTT
jgi:cation:H+ antiporter